MKLTVGAVVRGKTSLDYKTGAWRDERPVIRMDECNRCGICADVCPDTAVHAVPQAGAKKPQYVIDYEYCKGCGMCVHECPIDVIEMIAEEK
jgi:pyruvate ferredoxin oxidoreductase delta subunit